MMRVIRGVSVALVASALAGCGNESNLHSSQGLFKACPAGQIPWDFARFGNGLDQQSLNLLGIDGGSLDERLGEPNYIEYLSASCHNTVTNQDVDVTELLRRYCPPFKAGCLLDKATIAKWRDPAVCGNTNPDVTYTCHQEGVKKTFSWGVAKCESQKRELVSCVPENCYGHTHRDATLQCQPDLIKPVESKDTLIVNLDELVRTMRDPTRDSPDAYSTPPGGATVVTFDDEQLYRFKGTVEVASGPAPRQLLTLWLKSRVAKANSTVEDLDIFRCFIGRIDLRKYEPIAKASGGYMVPFDEKFRVPTECQDGPNFAKTYFLGVISNGLGVNEDRLPSSATQTTMMASYDLEGRAIVTTAGVSVDNTCEPKGADFFFNYTSKVHKSYDYYVQNQIPLVHRKRSPTQTPLVSFNAVPNNLVAATRLDVALLEYKVNKAGRAHGSIDGSLVVAMSGPDTGAWNQFIQARSSYIPSSLFPTPGSSLSSKGRRLSVDAYGVGNERYSTGLVPVPDTAVLDDSGQPRPDFSALIRLPVESLGLAFDGTLSETGATATMSVKLNNTLRTALFNPNGKYPLKSGLSRTYVLQVCAEGKVFEDFTVVPETGKSYVIHSRVGPAKPTKDYGSSPYISEVLADGDASTLQTAVDNCARSPVFSIKGENIVTPLPEVDVGDGDASDLNPTSSGDSDRLSGTFNSDTTQDCVGTRCETTAEQSFGGSDSPAKATVLSIVNDEEEEDTTDRFQTSFKLFGFDVFDAVENGTVGPVETTLVISPKYEEIAKAFGKPYPGFKIEGGHITASVNGLSVGFEYKVPLHFGPIQGDLIFGISAGAGVNFELTHTYNPKVASTCGTTKADGSLEEGCPDPMVALASMPFRQARDLCTFIGGRLAEPRSDAIGVSMRQKIAAGEEVWVGAQVGNEYRDNTDCAANWNSALCSTGHQTYLRWLSDAENFRKSISFGGFLNDGTSPVTSLSGTSLTTETLLAGTPVDSAVTLQDATFRVKPMTASYRSLCKRPLITKGTSNEFGLKLNVAAAAGFSLAFCTPSDELGVCLEGSVNLVEAKLTPGISFTHTEVSNNAGAKATQTKFGAKVDWSVNLLSGSLDIKVVTPFFDISYTLLGYDGFNVGSGTLTEFEYDFKDFPVGF